MKLAVSVPLLAVSAQAFVLPELFAKTFETLSINNHRDDASSWLDALPSKDSIVTGLDDGWNALFAGVDSAVEAAEHKFADFLDISDSPDFDVHLDFDPEGDDDEKPHPPPPPHPPHRPPPHRKPPHHKPPHHKPHHGPPPTANLTIYELISLSNHTKIFKKLVDKFDDIVDLLNSTEANYTLFVPADSAFEHIPKDKKPSDEFLAKVVKYHILEGLYPARKAFSSPTLPTILEEKLLGGPQRLRTSVGIISGVHLNFYSKVIRANFPAKNGVIHAVSKILIPPPFVGKELSLLPSTFSTLLHAYEKTDFVSFIHGVKTTGSTVFAPSNKAFAALGPRANAFLFNTEKGLGFLKALLKYQVVANATLYSNALYEAESEGEEARTMERSHVELTTLLNGTSVGVDISRWGTWVGMKLNGYVPVVVRDGIALNGVIQVVGRVPLPPRKPHLARVDEEEPEGEMEVEDLVERLRPYVEGIPAEDEQMGDL
jgi:uncharacterized surface protein with fasciclin (FAS1) repeats